MNHKDELDQEMIDLGCATVETKGPPNTGLDVFGGANINGGISDD
ncbi:benenodin family lasso peptide [Sphingomonas oryzagri]